MSGIVSGEVEFSKLIGATVKVRSACLTQGKLENVSTEYKIEDIKFRVSIDGKTFAIVKLENLPENTFTLRDLEIISLNNE